MTRLPRGVGLALALLVWLVGGGAIGAQERVTVTVRQLFDQGHRLELTAGGEVVWADAHFDRVWFPAGTGSPKVERMPGGSARRSRSRGPTAERSRSRPGTGRTTSTT